MSSRSIFQSIYFGLLLLHIESSPQKEQLCQVECKGVKERPVCGTDGVTYRSRCELQEALCAGFKVKFRHRGSCHTEADGSRCFEDRRSAMKTGDESGIPIFVPECNSDGSYKQVQCHKGTGYCWCVNDDGKPVPGSSVRHSKPMCHLLLATGRFRRGKKRNKSRGGGDKGGKKKRSRKVCTQRDRSAFSSNLLEMVSTEHASMFGARGRPNGTILGNAKKEVGEWKFEQLDEDRDGILKRKELKKFRTEIKKVLRPRRCARTFTKYCDQDSDRKISRKEWKSCLGIEESISFNLFASLISDEDETRRSREKKEKKEAEVHEIKLKSSLTEQQQQDQASPPSLYGRQFISAEPTKRDKGTSDKSGPTDCSAARNEASGEAKKGNLVLFIPECTSDGQYQYVQCYKSEGYCWCVEPSTGRPIPGTSTRNSRPQCGTEKSPTNTTPRRKKWRKCEGDKRTKFLSRLFDWMTAMVANTTLPTYLFDNEPDLSINQRVAKWQFIELDNNRNGFLEKREVKRWKKVLKTVSGLSLCGKRINQYCDSNKDTRISQQEWTGCLGVSRDDTGDLPSRSAIRPVGIRRGPNPLKTWLKGD